MLIIPGSTTTLNDLKSYLEDSKFNGEYSVELFYEPMATTEPTSTVPVYAKVTHIPTKFVFYVDGKLVVVGGENNNVEVASGRDTVTISTEEYNSLMRKGYTLLWEGLANKTGSADNDGHNYTFKQANMDIDNYDFILIEYKQTNTGDSDSAKDSNMINSSSIIKNHASDIRLNGYDTRYTDMHFVNNGFVIDIIEPGGATCYLHVIKIYGINL